VKYYFITDNPEIAAYVDSCGVERIFIDLEIHGKAARQGGRDTVISRHRAENIGPVKRSLRAAKLLVRVNPLYEGTPREVDAAIEAGADYLMLPMFRSADEVHHFCRFVGGRAGVIPLAETAAAVADIDRLVHVEGVSEIHVGLNDLHLDLGLTFMFQTMADGTVDRVAECCRHAHVPFGVGGISSVGQGLVPGEMVLAEHRRIGSTATILSRTFHQKATSLEDLQAKVDFPAELAKLRAAWEELTARTEEQMETDHQQFCDAVSRVVAKIA
jgi:hypothetical protein